MGSKAPQTSTTVNAPNPQAEAAYGSLISQAQGVAATPYQPYTGQLVAGVNGEQNQGINAINGASGVANPYINSATGYANQGAQTINPTQFSAGQVGQYESPYQSQVINSTEAQISNQNQQQQQQLTGNTIQAGAFGGDRAGIAQAALAGQQDIANNSTLANLNNQNYSQALGEFNQQQQTGLSAAQNNAARQGQAAFTLGSLGQEAQSTALTGANAQLQAGGLQQGTQQAQLSADYQQFLNQQAYPFQTTGWLGNLVEGAGSQMGGTSQTTSPGPSSANSIIGGGLGLASLFLNRGGRVAGYAGGGGVGGVVGATPYMGAQGYVPTDNVQIGHTMPTGSGGAGIGAANQQSQLGQQNLMSGLKTFGSAFQNSSLGDSVQDAIQDMGDGLARGGAVRPRYADGGDIGPQDLMFDPSALNTGGQDSQMGPSLSSGPDVAPPPPIAPTGVAAADNAPSAPAPVSVPTTPSAPVAIPHGGYTAHTSTGSPVAVDAQGNAIGTPSGLAPAVQPSSGAGVGGDSTWPKMVNQESGGHQFDKNGNPLRSPADAYGAAQVTMKTGPEAAQLAGLPWDPQRLMYDKDYNLALGHAYYQKQLQTFGSPGLAAAAYNAGPTRVYTALDAAQKYGGSYVNYLPKETQHYVAVTAGGGGSPSGTAAAANGGGGPSQALAFDSDAPQSGLAPAGQAISNATSGQGSTSDQGPLSQLFGIHVSPEVKQSLLAAGLGMMASRSPWAGQAIGEGGLAGLKQYQASQTMGRENALAKANIANQQGTLALGNKKQDFVETQANRLLAAAKAGADALNGQTNPDTGGNPLSATPSNAPPVLTPETGSQAPQMAAGAPQAARAPVAPSAPGVAPQGSQRPAISPQSDPAYLDAQAARYQQAGVAAYMNPEIQKNYFGLAQQARSAAASIRANGTVTLQNGQTGLLPGYADSKGQIAATEARAKGTVENDLKPGFTPSGEQYVGGDQSATPGIAGGDQGANKTGFVTPNQTPVVDPETWKVTPAIPAAPPGGGFPVPNIPKGAKLTGIGEPAKELAKTDGEFNKDMVSTARATPTAISRFQSLAQAFKTFQSGTFADHQHSAAAVAVALGQPDIAQKIMNGSVSGPEWVNKEGVNLTLDTLKAATPRFAQSEFNQLSAKGTPNTTNQPQANHQLIAEGLALANRNQDFMNSWEDARQAGWTSPTAFYTRWQQANPIDPYIKSAQNQIGNFAGMDLPSAQNWSKGSIYVAPAKPPAATGALLGKYGVQPGGLFRYNGKGAPTPVSPIAKSDYFSAQLGAQ